MIRYYRLFRNISNWWLHFAVKFSLTTADPLLFQTRKNVLVQVPRRLLHEFKEILLDNCYFRGLELNIPGTPTIIDVGANAGFFTLLAVSKFPGARVLSFEPIESNFRQLQRNRDMNKDHDITIFPKAVFGYSGTVSLTFDLSDGFTTAARISGPSDKGEFIEEAPCVTLPEIFEENHIIRCDLLKLDCEGSEYSILYNCPSEYFNKITQMAIEVHIGPKKYENVASLRRHLMDHNFEIRQSGRILWAWHG